MSFITREELGVIFKHGENSSRQKLTTEKETLALMIKGMLCHFGLNEICLKPKTRSEVAEKYYIAIDRPYWHNRFGHSPEAASLRTVSLVKGIEKRTAHIPTEFK